jgi:crotonobetainyl-CoA:carnitine CoA-transferase CaiB-like acyl-CoA transferase
MLGADVTRVQPPGGDYGRAAATLHRAKRAVTLDLGSPSGRSDLVDLVGDADVFLHNWRPGKARQWGLDVSELSGLRPGLVYAHLSGWGEGAHPRGAAGTDFLVQAHAGLGEGLSPAGEPPVPSRVILCDLFGALVAAEGILTALLRRERTGGSWEVRSSLLAGAMALQEHALRDGLGRPDWGPLDRPIATADGWLVVDGAERRLSERWEARTAKEWEARLVDVGVPCAVVCDDLAAVPADSRFAHLFEPVELADGAGLAPRSPWTFE